MVAFVDLAFLHNEAHVRQQFDIGKRISTDRDEIGITSGLNRAKDRRLAQEVSGVTGRSHDRFQRRHSGFDHVFKLARVVSMRIHTRVSAERDLHPLGVGARERLLDQRAETFRLLRNRSRIIFGLIRPTCPH